MQIPIAVYLFVPIVVASLVYQFVLRKRGLAATTHATVGALAARLGMSVMEGDPGLNLYYLSQPSGNFKRNIRLQGSPYGHRAAWDFTDGSRKQDFLVVVKTTITWGCYLVVHPNVQLPDFEVSPHQPAQYLEPDLILENAPLQRTGNAAIDATYRITSLDPRVAATLEPVLRAMQPLMYFHLVAQNGVLMVPVTRYGLGYFTNEAEKYLYLLECVACAFEGRQPSPIQALTRPLSPA